MSIMTYLIRMPPWRNRLARSAVNRKVGGSSPPGGDKFFPFLIFRNRFVKRAINYNFD